MVKVDGQCTSWTTASLAATPRSMVTTASGQERGFLGKNVYGFTVATPRVFAVFLDTRTEVHTQLLSQGNTTISTEMRAIQFTIAPKGHTTDIRAERPMSRAIEPFAHPYPHTFLSVCFAVPREADDLLHRVDGLYEVVGKENRYNSEGGLYERFELRRIEEMDQPDLEDIVRTSPTPQEQADFARIQAGY